MNSGGLPSLQEEPATSVLRADMTTAPRKLTVSGSTLPKKSGSPTASEGSEAVGLWRAGVHLSSRSSVRPSMLRSCSWDRAEVGVSIRGNGGRDRMGGPPCLERGTANRLTTASEILTP